MFSHAAAAWMQSKNKPITPPSSFPCTLDTPVLSDREENSSILLTPLQQASAEGQQVRWGGGSVGVRVPQTAAHSVAGVSDTCCTAL